MRIKAILLFIAVFVLLSSLSINANRRYRHKCLCGYLYWDWAGRPFGMTIPVLNKKGEMVQCPQK